MIKKFIIMTHNYDYYNLAFHKHFNNKMNCVFFETELTRKKTDYSFRLIINRLMSTDYSAILKILH